MALAKLIHPLTRADYLEIELASETKNEFLDGEMFAMAGASPSHHRIAGNLFSEFRDQLRRKSCEAFSEMRVQVEATGDFAYPDVSVACPAEFGEGDSLLNPSVLVEVLSDSTEKYDRGKKSEMYRRIPSLQEYLIVSQHKPHIEHFVRQANGQWLLSDLVGSSATLTLVSIGVTVPLATVYERVHFPPNAVPDAASQS